jgi:phospholipase/carboxylesterase
MHNIADTVLAGKPLEEANKVMILVHGRGASAASILPLAQHLVDVRDFALVAPNASGGTWYPYSFMAPESDNEPFLSAALDLLGAWLAELQQRGFASGQVYFAGFSQGACLVSEFLGRHAQRFGGAAIFTGGLIGKQLQRERYQGDFGGTPIFIGSGNPDFHVPVERVHATVNIFRDMGAAVTERIYPNKPHGILPDEIEKAKSVVRG